MATRRIQKHDLLQDIIRALMIEGIPRALMIEGIPRALMIEGIPRRRSNQLLKTVRHVFGMSMFIVTLKMY